MTGRQISRAGRAMPDPLCAVSRPRTGPPCCARSPPPPTGCARVPDPAPAPTEGLPSMAHSPMAPLSAGRGPAYNTNVRVRTRLDPAVTRLLSQVAAWDCFKSLVRGLPWCVPRRMPAAPRGRRPRRSSKRYGGWGTAGSPSVNKPRSSSGGRAPRWNRRCGPLWPIRTGKRVPCPAGPG